MIKRVLIGLFMIVSMFASVIPGSAYAKSVEFDPADYEKLKPDVVKIIESGSEESGYFDQCFVFVPDENAKYIFKSFDATGDVYPYCLISRYDKKNKEFVHITDDNDGGEEPNMFKAIFDAEAGQTYKIEVAGGYDSLSSFKVLLLELPYKTMTYTPKDPFIYNENEGGEYEWDIDDGDWYHYDVPTIQAGDTLTLTTINDELINYVYNDNESAFMTTGGDRIEKESVTLKDTQYSSYWNPGRKNYVIVRFDEYVYNVPVTIMHPHLLTKVEGIAPSCTKKGIKTHWVCEKCGGLFSDSEGRDLISDSIEIDMLPHDLVKMEAKKPGTTKVGNIKCWTCKLCKKHFADAKGNKELGYISWVIRCSNPVKVKGKTLKVKAATLRKKNVTFKKACTVKNAKGEVTYEVTKNAAKAKNKITVAESGKVTVKKGLRKGTYKLKVQVTAEGNKTYKAKARTVAVTVKVS